MSGSAISIHAVATDSGQVGSLVESAVTTYGRLDFAFNTVGISGSVPGLLAADVDEDAFDKVIAVNPRGVWLCMKYEMPALLMHGGGCGERGLDYWSSGNPTNAASAASKHAVIGMTRSFALAYADQGVRANAVCPGYIDTPMSGRFREHPDVAHQIIRRHPIGRLGTASEVARIVVWLSSDASSFVTGHALIADGGYTAQ